MCSPSSVYLLNFSRVPGASVSMIAYFVPGPVRSLAASSPTLADHDSGRVVYSAGCLTASMTSQYLSFGLAMRSNSDVV